MQLKKSDQKIMHLFLCALLFVAGPACAKKFEVSPTISNTNPIEDGSFEDTKEFLAPPSDSALKFDEEESRSVIFKLIKADGSEVLLFESNPNLNLKPASTMKLFTGWWAFRKKVRTTTYLSKMLRESVNSMAQSTLTQMGGTKAMFSYYKNIGLPITDQNFIPADGSGLSYNNQTNCTVEIALLKYIHDHEAYSSFKNLLAQPGQVGTLRSRLKSLAGKVFAKTGTLNRTAALTGFVETSKGVILFCAMSDFLNVPLNVERAQIDSMVTQAYLSVEAMNSKIMLGAN